MIVGDYFLEKKIGYGSFSEGKKKFINYEFF